MHHVYVVRCADGTLYTGYARDVQARERAHNAGRGARYTSGRRPVTVVYSESFRGKSAALRREYELKCWPRWKKEALVLGGSRGARRRSLSALGTAGLKTGRSSNGRS